MRTFARRFGWIVHPVTVFVFAQICWALLVFTWIWWYFDREKTISSILAKVPAPPELQAGQWIILLQGGILLALILLGLLLTFISQRRQVRLNRLHESFLSNITHELKTPIASIRLATETLLLRNLADSDRKKFLERTLSESFRLQNLVDSILVAARLESKSYNQQKELIDLPSVVEKSVDSFRERAGNERRIDFETKYAGARSEFLIEGDPIQIQMLFDNLLSNAQKYTNSGGRIVITSTLSAKGFSVSIADDGVGIEKESLSKIFDKFYRAEGTARIRVQGSGLGLFIARSVAVAHGGTLTASSDGPEKGAQFNVSFEGKSAARRG
ncbi:MAG: sensor histidine kinase [Proteobacteria bacterium]|nr:sensor histidine kinase [Pseudomonadota bacterium]